MLPSESPYIIASIHLASLIVIWVLTFAARLIYQGYRRDEPGGQRVKHISRNWEIAGLIGFTLFCIIQYSGTVRLMLASTNRVKNLHVYIAYILMTLPMHSLLNGLFIVGYKGKYRFIGALIVFIGCLVGIYIL